MATPSLVLDRNILDANIDRLIEVSRRLGVRLRPHMKTPKSEAIAARLVARQVDGFVVSTVRELIDLNVAGLHDLFYAVPLEARKVARIADAVRANGNLSFLIDNLAAARACAEAALVQGVRLPFWVELDIDNYRTGIAPEDPSFMELVRFLQTHPAAGFRGLMSYGGASYSLTPAAAADLAETHRRALIDARDRVVAAGLHCPALSFGSTPAVLHARTLAGIDEVRCGISLFQDLFQAGIGAAENADIAVSVLTAVIGVNRNLNRIVIDAGGLALSKDRSTQGRPFDAGYGLVCDAVSGEIIPDLYVSAVSQELGLITSLSSAPIDFDNLPIGRRLRILPNHADMTAAAYEEYHVVAGDDVIEAIWSRRNGW